jgi:hypothetical protein
MVDRRQTLLLCHNKRMGDEPVVVRTTKGWDSPIGVLNFLIDNKYRKCKMLTDLVRY